MVELLPARFQGPPKNGCYFFLGLFFLFFFLFLLHLARGCSKTTYFYRFLHTLLKHLVTSCSNNQVKPKLPPKKVHNFFFGNLFFDQKQLSKTLILHRPLKTVHSKNLKNPIFIVIDLTVAKLLTLRWPSYVAKLLTLQHIYIYIYCEVIVWARFGRFRGYYLGQVGVVIWAKVFLAYFYSGFKRFGFFAQL